jgi:hypothetical protein
VSNRRPWTLVLAEVSIVFGSWGGCHDHVTSLDLDLYDNCFFSLFFSFHSTHAHATRPLFRVDSHTMTHLLVSDSFLGQRS